MIEKSPEPSWGEIDRLVADRDRVILERDDAREEIAQLRILLKTIEWIGNGQGAFCPHCYGWSPEHRPDCELKPALETPP